LRLGEKAIATDKNFSADYRHYLETIAKDKNFSTEYRQYLDTLD